MTLEKGNVVVERYRLEERLGAGAFGEVWRVNKLSDGQDVGRSCAIKMMRLARDGRTGRGVHAVGSGWLDEVRALQRAHNRLAGGTIPEIHDANAWDEYAYIAMELLAGGTLAARLAEGPLAWRRALFIAGQVAQALEAAHAEGVIHRDLKPQNVILAGPHRVCVIDWGIARLRSPAPEPRGVAPDCNVSDGTEAEPPLLLDAPRSPALIGTPGYIAPEVYEGASPAVAQDTFALGVVLYEMISGVLPHAVARLDAASSSADSVRAYRTELDRATQDLAFVPLRERCPGVPKQVVALVDALLAPLPERRPVALRAAIEQASRYPHGVPDPPYVGLSKLGLEHAGLFFGQDDAIDNILTRLKTQRAVLLWGPSGSGKSSLALAGVAAAADSRLFLGMDGWDVHVVRPREAGAMRVLTGELENTRASRLGQMVVIDQFEEVVDLEPSARDAFCKAVLGLVVGDQSVEVQGALIRPSDTVRLIATIRDDLEWRVDREVPALRPLLEQRVIVNGVDANFARSIIAEPAAAAGYEVEQLSTVVREVEESLSRDAAKLPVVQFALSKWWEGRDTNSRRLPIVRWKGVDGTLSFVAESFYASLAPAAQERLHAIFLRLFSGKRRRSLPVADVAASDLPLLEELVRLRLVGRRERQGEPPLYEVEHESLIQHWPLLSTWLQEAREDRQLAEDLEREAAGWNEHRDPERLWKKRRLIAGEDLVRRGSETLSDPATAFLHAGRRAARRGQVTLGMIVGVVLFGSGAAISWQVETLKIQRSDADRARNIAEEATEELKTKNAELKSAKEIAEAATSAAKASEAEAQDQAQKAKESKDEAVKALNERDQCQGLATELNRTKSKLAEKTKDLEDEIARRKAGAEARKIETLIRQGRQRAEGKKPTHQ